MPGVRRCDVRTPGGRRAACDWLFRCSGVELSGEASCGLFNGLVSLGPAADSGVDMILLC